MKYEFDTEEQYFEYPTFEPSEGEFDSIYETYDSDMPDVELNDVATGNLRIEDRTGFALKDRRKGRRVPSKVNALVLHQMAFSRGNNPDRYNGITAHYAILPNGRILQLHPITAILWSSNGFNRYSVAVEFAGNLPNTRGKCWESARFGCHKLTQEQIEAGRYLVRYLIDKIGLTHIFAHRQALRSRENCPGPDIWYNVGQWAVNNLGLSDGGTRYKIGTGNPIPDAWRNWRGSVKKEMEAYYPETIETVESFKDYEDARGADISLEFHDNYETYEYETYQTENLDQHEDMETDVSFELAQKQDADVELEESWEALPSDESRMFKKVKYGRFSGYKRAGGGRVDQKLMELRNTGRISITDTDIDMLQRIANVETGGVIQAINSYDSAIMSMGIMQWTILYGELQKFISKAPEAFKRYGIELSGNYKFRTRRKRRDGTYYWHEWTVAAIRGASNKDDLRSLEWAKRFYYAGLDPDVVCAEILFAIERLKEHKLRIVKNKNVGNFFLPYYEKSASLRALIHETYNNRPAYLYTALSIVALQKMKFKSVSLEQFVAMVHNAIKAVYKQKEGSKGLKKASNLIGKTARIVP